MLEFPSPLPMLSTQDTSERHQAYAQVTTALSDSWLSVRGDYGTTVDWVRAFRALRRQILDFAWNHYIPADHREHVEYILLGSAARGEELPGSDLDYAIVSDGVLSREEINPSLEQFNLFMYESGFPPCDGFVMGTNHRWIGTETEWATRVEEYLKFPNWTNSRYLYIMVDSLPRKGANATWTRVVEEVRHAIRTSPFLLWEMAHLGIHNSVARTWHGQVKTKDIDGEAYFLLKDGLINPIVQSLRLLCLQAGFCELPSIERLRFLVETKTITSSFAEAIERALLFGWYQRIDQFFVRYKNAPGGGNQASRLSQALHSKIPEGSILWKALDEGLRAEVLVHVTTAKELERLVHRTFPKRG